MSLFPVWCVISDTFNVSRSYVRLVLMCWVTVTWGVV
nr:MAG TPA: hypothetical protein [Caudoviricetes sp.]